MKISNGSSIEFLIGIILIVFGNILFKILGIIILIHCIYLWLKIRNENMKKKDDNKKK